MMTYLENEIAADGWQDLIGRFHYAAEKMIEAGYGLPTTSAAKTKQQTHETGAFPCYPSVQEETAERLSQKEHAATVRHRQQQKDQ
jgi:hypothetical protein